MNINWDEVEKDNQGTRYVTDGEFTTTIKEINVKDVTQSGSYPIEFVFNETDEGKVPKATHWLTFKEGKDGWRQWHMKNIFVMLGASDKDAKKVVEACEGAGNNQAIADTYETKLNNLNGMKKKKLEVEVWQEWNEYKGRNYGRAEFTDPNVGMPHDATPAKATASNEEVSDKAEDTSNGLDLSDIPF